MLDPGDSITVSTPKAVFTSGVLHCDEMTRSPCHKHEEMPGKNVGAINSHLLLTQVAEPSIPISCRFHAKMTVFGCLT